VYEKVLQGLYEEIWHMITKRVFVARTAIGLVPTIVFEYNLLSFSTLENNYSASCLTLIVTHV